MAKPKILLQTLKPFPQSMSPVIRLYITHNGDPEISWESSVDPLPFQLVRVFSDALAEVVKKAEALAALNRKEQPEEPKSKRKKPA